MKEIIEASYSKNKALLDSLIVNEIHEIEKHIVEASNKNQYEVEVTNTFMTKVDDNYIPLIEAKAHCEVSVNNLSIDNNPKENEFYGDYRIGEKLRLANMDTKYPTIIKITDVDNDGKIKDFSFISRGYYNGNLLPESDLVYEDLTNYLDIYKDFGLTGDIRINRDLSEQVKTEENQWVNISGVYYNEDSIPPSDFGDFSSIYIVNKYSNIWLKADNFNWVQYNKYHCYKTFVLPEDFGVSFSTAYGVFGKNYIKLAKNDTNLRWYEVHNIYRLNYIPASNIGLENDILYYTTTIGTEEVTQKYVKLGNIWHPIYNPIEYDFSNKPDNAFGENNDLFKYTPDLFFVKFNGEWIKSSNQYRYDMIHTYNDFGDDFDMIRYTGEYQENQWYVKLNNFWVKVQKIWDLNEYKIGVNAKAKDITYGLSDIILESEGNGYYWDTEVIFSSGDIKAHPVIVNNRIKEVIIDYEGTALQEVPEISFIMYGDDTSFRCYEEWKNSEVVNYALKEAMDYIINYFTLKNYSIVRVTNKTTGNTFNWLVRWY